MKKPKVIKRNPTTRTDSTAMSESDAMKARLIQMRRNMIAVLKQVDEIAGIPTGWAVKHDLMSNAFEVKRNGRDISDSVQFVTVKENQITLHYRDGTKEAI